MNWEVMLLLEALFFKAERMNSIGAHALSRGDSSALLVSGGLAVNPTKPVC